jgi:hypothetical protein
VRRVGLVVALGLAACGGGGDDDGPPATCGSADAGPPGDPVAGALAIGLGEPASFQVIGEDEAVELVRGPQGGWMVTPVLRVDASKLASDGICAHIEIGAVVDGADPLEYVLDVPQLAEDASYLYTDALPVFLSFDVTALVGKACTLSATVGDEGATASAEVRIGLINQE